MNSLAQRILAIVLIGGISASAFGQQAPPRPPAPAAPAAVPQPPAPAQPVQPQAPVRPPSPTQPVAPAQPATPAQPAAPAQPGTVTPRVVSPGAPVLATHSNPATPPTLTHPYYLNPSVSQHLQLTDRQLAQLREANTRFQAHYQNELGRLAPLSPADRQRRLRELEHSYNADSLQAALTVFTRDQASRYRQLELQNRGLAAFTDPKVQRQLNLSSSQVDQLRALEGRTQQAREDIDRAAQGNRVEANRRYEVLQRNTENRVNSILNANQRKTWQEMIGERFALPNSERSEY